MKKNHQHSETTIVPASPRTCAYMYIKNHHLINEKNKILFSKINKHQTK